MENILKVSKLKKKNEVLHPSKSCSKHEFQSNVFIQFKDLKVIPINIRQKTPVLISLREHLFQFHGF